MRRKLLILLEEYPFRAGEYSFIKTEIKYLLEQYDVSILCFSSSDEKKMRVDERINVYHYAPQLSFMDKVIATLHFCFSLIGIHEMARIIAKKKQIVERIYDAISYYGIAKQIQRFIKGNRLYDEFSGGIIYSYWYNAGCLAFLLDKSEFQHTKVISRVHGYDLYEERNRYLRQPFREYMNSKIDRLFFVAEEGRKYFEKLWCTKSKYPICSWSPIGTEDMGINILREKDVFRLVSCSDLIPLKRVNLIIEALAIIDEFYIEWVHFGDGIMEAELRILCERLLKTNENVKCVIKGFSPIEKIMNFYQNNNVDCFITTSETEGCPVSIQEAMSFGIPIIGTAVGEIPNMIKGNGILLEKNPKIIEIADAIRRIKKSTISECEMMREKSRELWKSIYDAEINSMRFVQELNKL